MPLVRRPFTRQPQHPVMIDWSNPLTNGLLDAWLPQSMAIQSVCGRKPTVSNAPSLVPGAFGIGAYAGAGSIRYDVGEWGESGPFCFIAICSFFRYSSTVSVVRKDGAIIPVQIASSTVRDVGWTPLDPNRYYFSSAPSGTNHSILLTNRESTTSKKMYRDGNFITSYASHTGYGSTTNPLCFLGTESNSELLTLADGLFFGGIAFNRALTETEIKSISSNPWQIFKPRQIYSPFSVGVTAQFLRPISDVSNSGWVPSTGTNLSECIGEAVRDDAVYISATAPGAIFETLLGTSTGDPASSIDHLPRIVMSAGSGGIIVRLKQGATVIKAWTYASLTGTDTLYEPTLTSGEIDSITDYTDLRLQLETTA